MVLDEAMVCSYLNDTKKELDINSKNPPLINSNI